MEQSEPRTLLEAEMRRVDISIRALAKRLADSDDVRRIDQERTNIKRWLDPDKGISDASSERLAPHFERPPDFFRRPSKPRVRQADRLEELEEKLAESVGAQATLARKMAGLQARVTRLEGRQEPGRGAAGSRV